MLNDIILAKFVSEFFGYGRMTAPFWFVGMEEAGAADEREAQGRLDAWAALGCKTVVDCADFHEMVQNENGSMGGRLFRDDASIQSTWGPLIRFFLRATGQVSITTESVRSTQASSWGRSNSDNCLVELLPLPSPNADDWLYSEWSSLTYLSDREFYRSHLLPDRITKLRKMILENRPQVVLFYGNRYLRWWSDISGVNFQEAERVPVCRTSTGQRRHCRLVRKDGIVFICTYHPSYCNQSAYFEGIADLLS